jgi:hypothetical protein
MLDAEKLPSPFKPPCLEGDGLQPVRNDIKIRVALATEACDVFVTHCTSDQRGEGWASQRRVRAAIL